MRHSIFVCSSCQSVAFHNLTLGNLTVEESEYRTTVALTFPCASGRIKSAVWRGFRRVDPVEPTFFVDRKSFGILKKIHTPVTFRFKSILLSALGAAWLALPAVALAQQPPARQRTLEPPSASPIAPQPLQNSIDTIRPNYELGTNDQILVHAPDAEELNDKPFRIDDDGTVTLPLVGVVKAAGLTVQQFEDDLKNRLKTYIKNPLINVTVVQFRSSPVFFVGEFQKPGIYALQGRHTLVEMLMNMGGLQPNASRRIKITRKNESGPIPLPGAIEDPQTKTSSVEINLAALSETAQRPAERAPS